MSHLISFPLLSSPPPLLSFSLFSSLLFSYSQQAGGGFKTQYHRSNRAQAQTPQGQGGLLQQLMQFLPIILLVLMSFSSFGGNQQQQVPYLTLPYLAFLFTYVLTLACENVDVDLYVCTFVQYSIFSKICFYTTIIYIFLFFSHWRICKILFLLWYLQYLNWFIYNILCILGLFSASEQIFRGTSQHSTTRHISEDTLFCYTELWIDLSHLFVKLQTSKINDKTFFYSIWCFLF